VYGPIYLVFVWYIIRSGFRFFFTAANPTIENGGFVLESKKKIYDLLPSGTFPKTLFFLPDTPVETIMHQIERAAIPYPFILKPDIGGQGRAVMIVKNQTDLEHYVGRFTMSFLVQAYVDYPQEVGIFYIRYPKHSIGRVTGIVGKGFSSVTGDGLSDIATLIRADDRLKRKYDELQALLGKNMEEVLPAGKIKILILIGNHARGAVFYDWQHLIDEKLLNWMDPLMQQVAGFHYGRVDIRFNTWEEMLQGENFSIIELNGAGSEPTHIYDPGHSLFFAWKEIIRHWHYLYIISKQKYRMGTPYLSLNKGLALLKANARFETELNEQHKALLKPPE
jgi:hypothetical protein